MVPTLFIAYGLASSNALCLIDRSLTQPRRRPVLTGARPAETRFSRAT